MRSLKPVSVLVIAGLMTLFVPVATATATSTTVQILNTGSGTKLVAGRGAALQASVPSGQWCDLRLSHSGARTVTSAAQRTASGLAEYRWQVPANVTPGAWLATVSCGTTKAGLLRGEVAEAGSATLRATGARAHHGPAATGISVLFIRAGKAPVSAAAAAGKGGGAYLPAGTLLIPGNAWLDGQGVNVYSDGGDGADGYYQCVELVNRLITTRGWSPIIGGNANQLYPDASTAYFNKYANGSGYHPVIGDIVVWGGGEGGPGDPEGYGHVSVVNANDGSSLNIVEQNASPSGYDTYDISSSGYIANRAGGYYVEGFLHAKANHIGGSTTTPTPTVGTTVTTVGQTTYAETVGGVTHTWTDYSDAGGSEGQSIATYQTVQVACAVQGFTVADGDSWWYQIASSPWSNNYYASADAFYNNGRTSGSLAGTPFVDPAVPGCGGTKAPPTTTTTTSTSTSTSSSTTSSSTSSTSTSTSSSSTSTSSTTLTTVYIPPPPTYYNETVGGVTHTWTDYSDAGGSEGQSIAAYQTVQVACAVQGFRVADGDTWWYRIASSPWNNAYYASADAFYNNGETSGSLIGTPFVDPAVPGC
jgi:hypothetical protein